MTGRSPEESANAAAERDERPAEGGSPRRAPTIWIGLGFVLLLGGGLLFSDWIASSGPQISWIENDFDAAIRKARAEKRYVAAYMIEDAAVERQANEQAFDKRWAREQMSKVVCVRVLLESGNTAHDRLRLAYGYQRKPLLLLINPGGSRDSRNPAAEPVVGRIEGVIDEKEFFTYFSEPIRRATSK